MDRILSISSAAKLLGVSITTLHRWEAEGKLFPARTAAGHRRYEFSKLKPGVISNNFSPKKTVAYARVSSHDQKEDLERQNDP